MLSRCPSHPFSRDYGKRRALDGKISIIFEIGRPICTDWPAVTLFDQHNLDINMPTREQSKSRCLTINERVERRSSRPEISQCGDTRYHHMQSIKMPALRNVAFLAWEIWLSASVCFGKFQRLLTHNQCLPSNSRKQLAH